MVLLIPLMVIVFDVISAFRLAFVTSVKVKAFGVVSNAAVVTLHVSFTPPTVTVAVIAVLNDALEVSRTSKVWPFVILPDVPHAPPLIDICAPVPVTDTGVVVLMPLMVTGFDVTSVLCVAPVTSVKVNALGVVSAATVATLHTSVTPPTFTVAVIVVVIELLDVRRTASVCPLVMVPDVPHAPPLIDICAPVPVTDTGVV